MQATKSKAHSPVHVKDLVLGHRRFLELDLVEVIRSIDPEPVLFAHSLDPRDSLVVVHGRLSLLKNKKFENSLSCSLGLRE